MGSSQFSLFGFPVRVELFFFVIMYFIASNAGQLTDQLAVAGVAGVSLLVHELGHAFAFRRFGGRDISIRLMGFGGLTTCRGAAPFTSLQHVVISGAGVASELSLVALPAYVALNVLNPTGTLETALLYAVWLNIIWAVFNLLPILDLDGGHIVQHLAHIVTGRDQTRAIRYLSIVVAGITAVVAWQIGFLFAGLFMGFMIYSNVQALAAMKDRPQQQVAPRPPKAPSQPPTGPAAGFPTVPPPGEFIPPTAPPTRPPMMGTSYPEPPPRSYPPLGRQD